MVPDIEKKFNEIVKKDFASIISEAETTGDLFIIELLTNFNDIFKMCVEEISQFNSMQQQTAPPIKRKRSSPKTVAKKPLIDNASPLPNAPAQNVPNVEIISNVLLKPANGQPDPSEQTKQQSELNNPTDDQTIDLDEIIEYVSETDGEQDDEEQPKTA